MIPNCQKVIFLNFRRTSSFIELCWSVTLFRNPLIFNTIPTDTCNLLVAVLWQGSDHYSVLNLNTWNQQKSEKNKKTKGLSSSDLFKQCWCLAHKEEKTERGWRLTGWKERGNRSGDNDIDYPTGRRHQALSLQLLHTSSLFLSLSRPQLLQLLRDAADSLLSAWDISLVHLRHSWKLKQALSYHVPSDDDVLRSQMPI